MVKVQTKKQFKNLPVVRGHVNTSWWTQQQMWAQVRPKLAPGAVRPADPLTHTAILDTSILLLNYDRLLALTGNFSTQNRFSSTNIISSQTLMADSICHYHCGTRPPPRPKQAPIFSILPLSPSPENEKKCAVEGVWQSI